MTVPPGFDPAWSFVVYAQSQPLGDDTLIAVTITSSLKDGPDALAAARDRTRKALGLGYDRLVAATTGVTGPDSGGHRRSVFLTRTCSGTAA